MSKLPNIVEEARAYALEKHAGQTYGDLPYEYHLRQVAELLEPFNDTIRAAGWLHDVVEDTDASLFEIRQRFGGHVAQIVDCCTDPPGDNRKQRKKGALQKLLAGPPAARTVKLADRICNMRASIENPGMAKMYRDEFPEFIRACGNDKQNVFLIVMAFNLYMDSVEAYK